MNEIIINLRNSQIMETEDFETVREQLLEEIAGKLLTPEEKMLLKRPRVRKELYLKCGKKAFLMPDELKFPIISPLSEECKPDCRLLYAAYLRANEWKKKNPEYVKIAEQAKKLFAKQKCDTKVKIHIRENEYVDLEEFLALF